MPHDSVISWAKQWGITFPVATDSGPVGKKYTGWDNGIYLIDKQGIVRAITSVPLGGPGDAKVDSAVQAVAEKIPALLAAAVRERRMPLRGAVDGAAVGEKLLWTGDLKGRRLDRAGAVKASQMVIDGAESHRTFIRSK